MDLFCERGFTFQPSDVCETSDGLLKEDGLHLEDGVHLNKSHRMSR